MPEIDLPIEITKCVWHGSAYLWDQETQGECKQIGPANPSHGLLQGHTPVIQSYVSITTYSLY